AVATGMAGAKSMAEGEQLLRIAGHSVASLGYMAVGLIVAPWLLRKLQEARWNILFKASPIRYVFVLLFSYVAVAAALHVTLVFAAFLAGFGLVGGLGGSQRARFARPVEAVAKVGRSLFIPIYFALVGYKLVFGREFSIPLLAFFLIGSSLATLLSFGLAARLA